MIGKRVYRRVDLANGIKAGLSDFNRRHILAGKTSAERLNIKVNWKGYVNSPPLEPFGHAAGHGDRNELP